MIKYIIIALAVILVAVALLIFMFAMYVFSTRCRRGHKGLYKLRRFVYAHRGLHDDGTPENSLEAFRRAKRAGYGVELDVHLLSDGNLVVFHDYLLERITGAKGNIEDLTIDQLSEYYLGDSGYTIPSFEDVLDVFDGQVPMIVELKSANNNVAELCEKTCKILENYGAPYCLESFDPRCIAWLRKNKPEIVRGQLTQNYFKGGGVKLPWIIKLALIHQVLNFITLPDFIAYRFSDRKTFSNLLTEKLWGAKSVAWTIRSPEDFALAKREGRIIIFEGFEP